MAIWWIKIYIYLTPCIPALEMGVTIPTPQVTGPWLIPVYIYISGSIFRNIVTVLMVLNEEDSSL